MSGKGRVFLISYVMLFFYTIDYLFGESFLIWSGLALLVFMTKTGIMKRFFSRQIQNVQQQPGKNYICTTQITEKGSSIGKYKGYSIPKWVRTKNMGVAVYKGVTLVPYASDRVICLMRKFVVLPPGLVYMISTNRMLEKGVRKPIDSES